MIDELPPKLSEAEDSFAMKVDEQRSVDQKDVAQLQNRVGCTVLKAMQWKSDMEDRMKKISWSHKEDPEHPVNSKLRKSLA